MTIDQMLISAILAAMMALFLWGRWRHDLVAAAALAACVAAGLTPAEGAFAGFGHPAVITVACVLALSHGLQQSGAVDALARAVLPRDGGGFAATATLTGLAAGLSAFMNNVGALALLMPLAIQAAGRHGLAPGQVLMPVAFGSILGGMVTLIGTPPNLIVAGFRAEATGEGFAMFDFAPVGLPVALAGLAVILVGFRALTPARERADAAGFDTGGYLTEARVGAKSRAAGMTLREVEAALERADAQVVGLVRAEYRIPAPSGGRKVRAGDILVLEAEPEGLAAALSDLGLTLEEAVEEAAVDEAAPDPAAEAPKPPAPKAEAEADKPRVVVSDEVVLGELAVRTVSPLVGRSATDLALRSRHGLNLLAVSRQGAQSTARLRRIVIRAGDVLLLQGRPEALADFAARFDCVPLAARELRLPDRRRAMLAVGLMAAAVAAAAFGLAPAAVAFAGALLGSLLVGVISPRAVYGVIDWPVIVLLAALLPVAGALQATGTADLLAGVLLEQVAQGSAVWALLAVLVLAMGISDLMNNAATAAVMCPLALGVAERLGVSPDPFLMAVAVGASCAFLTPIGHQNNTLILGPGGFRFGDYWRLGLPVELAVIAVAMPLLLWVWPM